jgi:hypothetical protein
MALRLNGSTSGYVEIDAPAVAGDNTLTLPSTPNGSLVALDSSGRLGIGTTSPNALLDVTNGGFQLTDTSSSFAASESISYYHNTSTQYAEIQFKPQNAGQGYIYFKNRVGSALTDVLTIQGSNVGIGITSPASALHVVTSGAGAIRHADGARAVSMGSTGTISYIGSITAGNGLALYSANEEKARIDASGRLLVGASSGDGSANKFQVKGNTSSGNTGGGISLSRGAIPTAVNQTIGLIDFGDGDGDVYAQIKSQCDGTAAAGDAPGRLVFSTTADGASVPTERMRIDSSGNVLVGTTSASETSKGAHIRNFSNGTILTVVRDNDLCGIFNRLNGNGGVFHFRRSSTTVGSISVTSTATTYNTSSDYRLKENVTAVTDGITRLQQLKPSRFNFIADPDTIVDGFLAHEAQAVVPECITGTKDEVDDEGNPVYQGIDQSKLVPLLTAALQEAIAKIEALEARITTLEVTP